MSALRPATHPAVLTRRLGRGLREIALLGGLYGMYSLTRSLADDSFGRAARFAERLRAFEEGWGLDVEAGFSRLASENAWLGLAMSYWYASLHFLVTVSVLGWLFFRRRDHYAALRNALVLATSAALVLYLLLPTAPPRLLGPPFHDVLAENASAGWWGDPGGVGGIANELAAFPSMHAGWALWVAIVLWICAPRWVGRLGLVYAGVTAVVVIGTGNHWTVDVVAGWIVVALGVALTARTRSSPASAPTTDLTSLAHVASPGGPR